MSPLLPRRTVALAVLLALAAPAAARPAENVVVVTLDGFRWQEFFTGADESYIDGKLGGVRDVPGLKRRYLRDTPEERRAALLPFLWGTVAKQGQIFGNPARKAAARSTNGRKFSYPGYSELFCGVADPRIDSNAKRDNSNPSVFEFLHGRPGFRGKVEAVCTWDVFPFILRSRQSGLPVHAGWRPLVGELTEREKAVNDAMDRLPRYWPDNTFDLFTMEAARSALERRRPRVLYVALGETDEWGHGRRYDLYLDSARNADRFLGELWDRLQADPQYRDRTALIVTTDHGRGPTRADWTDHGEKVPGAEFVWVAAVGAGVPARGEREGVEVTQSQVAATVAAVVGEDFRAAVPAAAPPLPLGPAVPEIIGHRGASFDAPENTVAAMKLAWEQGADASELDTYLSRDGTAVVIHDATTKRVAGTDRKVADTPAAELTALDVGRWKGPAFAGEKLPTLAAMLAAVAPGKRVFVEVKCGPEIVPELLRRLDVSGLPADRTPVISFHAEVVAAVKKARPAVPAYLLASLKPAKGKEPPTAERLIAEAKRTGADGLDLSADPALDAAFAGKVRAAGLKLYVWTVNDPAVARRMAALGVDGITTDRPGWLRAKLAE
jgi:glycerophosphoryl diester phosphodiesterase